jgi:hypothetical protein
MSAKALQTTAYFLIGLLLASHAARANPIFDYDPSGPMIFREGFNGGNCNGCEWIIAEGTIQPDTPQVFAKFLELKKSKGVIRFNSPGGNLLAGMKLGEMIRSAGLFTAVGKTVGEQSSFDADTIQEKPLDGPTYKANDGICASACVYAFIGGGTRFASKSKIGIHQFYDGKALNEPLAKTASAVDRSVDQLLAGLLLEYVMRMGVDARLISLASSVPPWEDMKWLSGQELLDLKIDNSETVFTPISVEPFGSSGSYVETVSRSVYYSFRHRVYCKGNARTAYIALLSNPTTKDAAFLKDSIGQVLEQASVVLIGGNAERAFPIRLAALEASKNASQAVQASALIVGATMADIQASDRVELRGDSLPRQLGNLAYWLSFNLTGDKRKIGIASRACLP